MTYCGKRLSFFMKRKNRLSVVLVSAAILLMSAVPARVLADGSPEKLSPLPALAGKGKMSLEETLAKRRSVRRFKPDTLNRRQIARLCWAAQGVSDSKRGFRTCPSAGALYPLELYVVTADGVEHYVPNRHAMKIHLKGDLRGRLQAAALGQSSVGRAPATFVITAVVSRTQRKYGRRARRYVQIEVGHAGQNLLLQATALGLAAVPVGAFRDKEVHRLLALPPGCEPLYLIPVGLPVSAISGNPRPKSKATLFSEHFDDTKIKSRKWYDMTRIRIVGNAFAGKGCIEYEWPDKKSKVKGSSPMRHLFKPTDEIYIRFYLKLSKGWGWTGRNYHPHLTHFMTTENSKWHGPAASHLTLYVEPVNGKLRLAAQDIQNKTAPHGLTQGPLRGGYNGKFYDSKKVLFKDDKWHCVEAHFKLNTLDLKNDRPNPDGIVRGWFDGKLVVKHTNVILRSTDFPKMKFNHFLLAPYFGPGLLPHAQKLWIDELTVSKKRIGPLSPKKSPKNTSKTHHGGKTPGK